MGQDLSGELEAVPTLIEADDAIIEFEAENSGAKKNKTRQFLLGFAFLFLQTCLAGKPLH